MYSERSYCFPDKNASCPKLVRRTEISVILYLFAVILIVVAVFGNLFVIITVSYFRQLHTPTNFFVVSLAVADFLNGLLIMPVQFFTLIDYCWYFGDAFCPYYMTYFYCLIFVSVLNLVIVSFDRYFAVCNPFFYSRYVKKSVAGTCIIFIWLLAFLYTYAFIYHTGGSVITDWCVGMCAFLHYNNWWIAHYVVTFLLPMMLIICLYSVIFVTARRHVKAINCMIQETKSADSKKTQLSKSSERKAAKTIGIVVIAFIVLCSPVIYLSTVNCSIDPMIYCLFYPCVKLIDSNLTYHRKSERVFYLTFYFFLHKTGTFSVNNNFLHVKAINLMMEETKLAHSKKTQLPKSSERKAAKTLGVVVIAFIMLCSPGFLLILVQMFFSIDLETITPVQLALIYLSSVNCCIDPIIYAFFYPWFRKSIKMMVTLEIFKSSSSMTSLFSN
uniref:G-protein coupled receptors family 1 profile domain-containing protein n=1 Tax=Erpetoichthys calabaricus TaxID=27687 RepID=A0A8C4RHW0_ERPCA